MCTVRESTYSGGIQVDHIEAAVSGRISFE